MQVRSKGKNWLSFFLYLSFEKGIAVSRAICIFYISMWLKISVHKKNEQFFVTSLVEFTTAVVKDMFFRAVFHNSDALMIARKVSFKWALMQCKK